jgi:hypothetical protein
VFVQSTVQNIATNFYNLESSKHLGTGRPGVFSKWVELLITGRVMKSVLDPGCNLSWFCTRQSRRGLWALASKNQLDLAKGWIAMINCGLGSSSVEQPDFEPEQWIISRKLCYERPGWCRAGIPLEP